MGVDSIYISVNIWSALVPPGPKGLQHKRKKEKTPMKCIRDLLARAEQIVVPADIPEADPVQEGDTILDKEIPHDVRRLHMVASEDINAVHSLVKSVPPAEFATLDEARQLELISKLRDAEEQKEFSSHCFWHELKSAFPELARERGRTIVLRSGWRVGTRPAERRPSGGVHVIRIDARELAGALKEGLGLN